MNELTPERLAEIKRYMTNVNLPFRVQTDLPILVAEVERLKAELSETHIRMIKDRHDWINGHYANLSAAHKRIGELEGLIIDATIALRLLHDHQNGPPLYKYEEDWNEAMRLTGLVLPKLEALTTPP